MFLGDAADYGGVARPRVLLQSSSVAKLSRELALEMEDGAFAPDFVQHLPGVARTVADLLSRSFQPGKAFEVPYILKHLPETVVPDRTQAFYIARNARGVSAASAKWAAVGTHVLIRI